MNAIVKKLAAVVVGLGVLAVGMMVSVDRAHADAVSSNTTTALTILITPNVDRGVEISSDDVTVNLGTVDFNVSTFTVNPATITIVGNISQSDLRLDASIVGGWSFDADPTGSETDKMATWALFTTVAISSAPTENEFEIYNSTIASDTPIQTIETAGDGSGRYEAGFDGSGMDAMAPSTQRHLWIRMRTPSDTTISLEQTVAFNLTAVSP